MENFKELPANKQLDEILLFLKDNPNQEIVKITNRFFEWSEGDIQSNLHYISSIIDFLTQVEKYVESDYLKFRITFRGLKFIEDGGYRGEAISNARKDATERINQRMLTWGAVGAAIGAILLFLLEGVKFLIDYNLLPWHRCCHP